MSGHIPKEKSRYGNTMLQWSFRASLSGASSAYAFIGMADREMYIEDVIGHWTDEGTQAGTFELLIVRNGSAPGDADVDVMDSVFGFASTPTGAPDTLFSLSKAKPAGGSTLAIDTLKKETANRKLNIGDRLFLKWASANEIDLSLSVTLDPFPSNAIN